MAQVKFYSVSTAPGANAPEGNLYFVNGGELYKGSQRFGANKIFTAAAGASTLAEATVGITGAIGGDVLTGFGATKIYTGNAFANPSWVDVEQDQDVLDQQLKALVSSLAFASDSGLYITGITQDPTTGAVEAHTSTFATDVKTAIGNGSASSVANGITVSVVTTSGSVTNVQVSAANLNVTSITAETGVFDNLTVANTAIFSATNVSATTLTVNGSTVNQIAQAEISDVTANAVTSTGTSLPTESAVYNFVTAQISSLDNAMHYIGTTSDANITQDATVAPDDIEGYSAADMKAGDIVLKGTSEYIWNGSKWELIGDQGAYAANAYSSEATVYANVTTVPGALDAVGAALSAFTYSSVTGGSGSDTLNGVTVSVVTAATTAAPTVTLAGFGNAATKSYLSVATSTDAGEAFDTFTSTPYASYLPTASAVAAYVTAKVSNANWSETKSPTFANTSATLTVTINTSASDKLTVTPTGFGTAVAANVLDGQISATDPSGDLTTESQVVSYVTSVIEGLDAASVSSSNQPGLTVSVTQSDGLVTAVSAELVWLTE